DSRREARVDVAGALGKVRDFFVEYLKGPDGGVGREYLADRDLLEAIDDFELGLAPALPGRLREYAERHKLPIDVLVQAGVLGRDGRREPMLGRLVFPIHDERGRVVGFGGRVLPGEADERRPKYVNSPESPFFNKRRLLYGLRQVKLAGTRQIIVVEGYTDAIACHLAGFSGAVATLGTALTLDHAKKLERYATEGAVLLFDGDRAGRQAAERAFRELVHTPLDVRIALLPEGKDPADLCGSGELAECLERAVDALTVWFRLLRQRLDLRNDAHVERAANECVRILSEIENPVRVQALQRRMEAQLGLGDGVLRPGAPRRRQVEDPAPERPVASAPKAPRKLGESDMDFVACLLMEPALLDDTESIEAVLSAGCTVERLAEVVEWLREGVAAGRQERPELVEVLLARAGEDAELKRFLLECADRAPRFRDPQGIFLKLRHGRQLFFAREQARQARAALEQALAEGDQELADRLTQHYMACLRKSKARPGQA
ncbi:MAG: toprim domain-containing protein, partial [Planctomycetes bacterium]|nr:toprim domain-containing protein [Planctomycetota bacterium]